MQNESDSATQAAELFERLRAAIGRAMVGQDAVIEQVIAALAASGHVLVEGYLDAWSRADVETLKALLAEDAVFSMPPWAIWWSGSEAIAGFSETATRVCPRSRSIPTRANGQPALATYSLAAETGRYAPTAIDVYTLAGERIKEITAFVMPELFPRFGLPRELR